MVGWHCNSDPIRAPPTYKGEKAGAEQQEWTYTKETPFLAITSNNFKNLGIWENHQKNIEKIATAWSRHSHAALEPPSPGRLHWSSHLCIFPWHQAPGPQMPKANKASMIFICFVPKKMLLIWCFCLATWLRPPEQSTNWSPVMSGLVCVCDWHDRSFGVVAPRTHHAKASNPLWYRLPWQRLSRPFMPSSKALKIP